MNRSSLHARSAGLGALAATAVLLALAAARPQADPATKWETRIVLDVEQDEAADLLKDGWEFVGYLGVSKRGANTDETLWRRPDR